MNRKQLKKIWNIFVDCLAIAGLFFVGFHLFNQSRRIMNKEEEKGYIARPEVKIENGKMTPEVLLSLGRLSDPQLSPDGEHILYGVSYTSIADNRSCRNLFICGTDGTDNRQITTSGKGISNARWCADGKMLLFIEGGQIVSVEIRRTGKSWDIGNKEVISSVPAGISEFKLSPDESMIMYTSSVPSAFKKPCDLYPDVDKARAYTAEDLMYRHWDHWVQDIPHTFICPLDLKKPMPNAIREDNSTDLLEGEAELYELPAEPFSGIEQLDWSPDGQYIAYSCKKLTGKKYAFSTNSEIYLYNVADKNCMKVSSARGYDTNPVWSPDGRQLCWLSMERDGYEADKQRLMISEVQWKNGRISGFSEEEDLTAGFKYNASEPVWDAASGKIYFSALAEGLQGIFCTLPSDHGKISRITGEDLWYDFNSPFSIISDEEGTTLYASWCSLMFPNELVAVNIQDGKTSVSPITSENKDILDQLDECRMEARHIRTVDGKDMLTWVVYPPHFDASKKYPAIEICLGGPQGTLSQGWSYRWNYRLMASQGYVVVMPNRRGTTAFGQEWCEQISGDYCGLNMQDYLVAARNIKAESYIGKIAACGASYGGYSVYNLCGIHGNTYDAFIAHAGIFNEEHMYMTTEEMWFANWDNGGLHEYEADPRVGTGNCPVGAAGDGETFGGIRQGGSPWSSAPLARRHYANSPHTRVTSWHTPILVTHGEIDYRVPVEQGMAAYNAAQMMGVPSRLIVFPEENHWILKPQNALYWHREYFNWLDRWCK